MSTSKVFFDIHKRKAELRQVSLFKFEFFEKATEDSIAQYKDDLIREEKELEELSRNMPEVNEDDHQSITEEEWSLIDEYSNLHTSIEFNKEYLFSLLEMNIVYLFKSLEIIMKKFIQIAYPKSNTKELYKWDNMITFFKSNDIEIVKLDGYKGCDELRKVNNAIKHNAIITNDIRGIKEFSKDPELNHFNLEKFYRRVKPEAKRFSEALEIRIEENLFDFPIERLISMAEEFSERMDSVTLDAFISKLKENLSHNENGGFPNISDELPF